MSREPLPAAPADAGVLLAEARKQMAWRTDYEEASPAEQEAIVHQQARLLALLASDIGKAAQRIGAALDELEDAVSDFLDRWPDHRRAEEAGRSALAAAGLAERGYLRTGYTSSSYAYVPDELRRWVGLIAVMSERLEECDARPDTATCREEWDALPRRVA